MKARSAFAAFGRHDRQGSGAMPAAPRNAKGSGAPASRHLLVLVAAIVAIGAILGATSASALAPVLTAPSASEVEYTTAHLEGEVNPEDHETSYHFEYATAADFSGAQSTATESLAEGAGPTPVSADLAGLAPATTYHLRLLATNTEAETVEAVAASSFETSAVAKPTLSVDPVTTFTDQSAHLVGHINPGAPEPEGSTSPAEQAAFETSWHFECVAPGPSCGKLSGAPVPAGNQAKTVEADAADLEPNKGYYVKLVAANLGGSEGATTAASPSFTTGALAPTVHAFAAGPVQSEAVDLNGEVNPHNSPTTYWFEWGSKDCSANPCTATAHRPAGVSEMQRVVVDASAGQFTLTFEGETTIDLPFDASPAQLQAALEALPSIGAGNVSVIGNRVDFMGELAATDVPALLAASGSAPLTKNGGAEPGTVAVTEFLKGSGQHFSFATERLTGLAPGTAYHFRLIAQNAVGTTAGPDEEFVTAATETCANQGALGTDTLPGCRAYELVSPPDKNGQDVIMQTDKTHVASDGDGVTFSALGGFGELHGTTFDTEYLARRTGQPGSNGWTTRGINPRGGSAPPLVIGAGQGQSTPTFEDAFTPDLSAAVYKSWRPLSDAPNVAEVMNLYRVEDLGDPNGGVQLLTDAAAPLPEAWPDGPGPKMFIYPRFAGASTDLSHVAFESTLALTADAPPYEGLFCQLVGLGCSTNLYENVDGSVRLVGRVPSAPATQCDDDDGPACVPAPSSEAGVSASARHYSARTVSADGSRIFFQTPGNPGLYLREDGERTYRLNASEAEPSAEPQDAELQEASRDGSRAFFTTVQSLVAEDENSFKDLYMYEVDKPAGHRLTLISASSASEASGASSVIGASDDGRYVYFLGSRQLVPGMPPVKGGPGIFLWHDGSLSYVGGLDAANSLRLLGLNAIFTATSSMKSTYLTPDGRHLLFPDRDILRGRGGLHNATEGEQLYLYSADSGRLECASCDPGGEPTAPAETNTRDNAVVSSTTSDLSHALSDDGRYVFFSTSGRLVDEDTNGQFDAYVYDARSGQAHLLSSGTAASASKLIDASDDGADAFFVTRERLSGWDTDTSYDLYDARIDGGLPEPVPVADACSGESCLPSPQPASPARPTASEAQGPGNPPRVCPKGSRRVVRAGKVRCIRRTHHKRNHDRRRAGADRRAGR